MPARGVGQMTEVGTYAGGCYELDKAGIREVQRQYVDASKRAVQAGFDIVNVQGAENGANAHALSDGRHNQRTDEYGGTFENRARFWLETLEQIREAVGDDCAITTRLCVDTLNDSPLGIRAGEEGYGFIALADHLVDFWDLQTGGWNVEEWAGEDAVPSRFLPEWHQRDHIAQARRATDQTGCCCRALHQPRHDGGGGPIGGHTDHCCSPSVDRGPVLAQEDRGGALRRDPRMHRVQHLRLALPSERADHLHSERDVGRGISARLASGALHEGREQRSERPGRGGRSSWHGVRACSRRAWDAGGFTSSTRRSDVGGSLRRIAAYPHLGEWARVINYRKIQLDRLRNVEVILSTSLSASEVLEYGAEIVVVATGSYWRSDGAHEAPLTPVPGADQEFVFTPDGGIRRQRRHPRGSCPHLRCRRVLHGRRHGRDVARRVKRR